MKIIDKKKKISREKISMPKNWKISREKKIFSTTLLE